MSYLRVGLRKVSGLLTALSMMSQIALANYGVGGGCGTGEKTGKCLNPMMKGKSAERHDVMSEERLIEEKRCLLLNKSDKNSICNNLILLLEWDWGLKINRIIISCPFEKYA